MVTWAEKTLEFRGNKLIAKPMNFAKHMKKPKALQNFYKSDAWKLVREIKFMQTNGLCERCGGIGQEVHHKVRLNIDNVSDVNVCINPTNLELLCKDCHNKEHKRFKNVDKFDENGDFLAKR